MRVKIVLAIFILTAVLAGVVFWYWQQNTFSTGNVKLEILAPEEITMGEEITYLVKWKNVGETELQDAILVFEYPEGFLLPQGEVSRVTKTVDDINPGQEASMRFTARILGKENEIKEAKAFLSYTPRNLSATFRNDTTATSKITFVPLNFALDIPSRIESGQQFVVNLNYFSNVEYPLSDLQIQMEYPEGFEFKSAVPSPLGESEWDIGLLNHANGDRISITGSLSGGVQEAKNFKATLGRWIHGNFTVLKEVTKAIEITKPRLFISQVVNSAPEYAASAGDILHYEIYFKNPTERILENLFLIVTLDGRGFDLSSIRTADGRFEKGDNSVVWEAQQVPKLRFLGKGEEGKVEFWVSVKEDIETFSPQDKELVLKSKVLLSEVSEQFEVKIKSDIAIEQIAFFNDEVFGNTGVNPPRIGQRNTYTITWRATNKYSDVQNARVKAKLPIGVELTGKISPEDAGFTYDSGSREIVWEIGNILAGTGQSIGPNVTFQVAFVPTLYHKGKVAELIGVAQITGEDLFVDQIVSASDDAIDTTLPDDPSISESDGVVQ